MWLFLLLKLDVISLFLERERGENVWSESSEFILTMKSIKDYSISRKPEHL